MMLRTLIVDDEPLARRRLRTLLRDEPTVDVIGECEDGPSAVAAVRRLSPDLILLDIQMPGMSGFDVLVELGVTAVPAVIFVTAHDQHAIRAFDVHALDYLLKPFDRQRLRQAIERAGRFVGGSGEVTRRILGLLGEKTGRYLDRIAVKSGGRVYFVRASEIDWIEATGHYLSVHAGPVTHLIRETIGGIESKLDPSKFARVHRSAIVHIDRIEQMRPTFHGEYELQLRGGTRLTSGRAYADTMRKLARSG
jgi:two-component system LytT family response regulator